jgi:7-cyano-7-deazaguanine synthase
MQKTKPKAVVLSSGGIDSTTALALSHKDGFAIHSLSFDYGQRHKHELEAAGRIASFFDVEEHLVVRMDMTAIGGSALTSNLQVPKGRDAAEMSAEIPVTYVPARNTIFLAYAMAWAEVICAARIVIGVNAVDYSGYPDCRPEFIEAFQTMANLATRSAVQDGLKITIHTPLIHMTKAQIIQTGAAIGVDYGLTHSCYDPSHDGAACGKCDSCILRMKGFQEAGVKDPTRYQ